VPSAKKTSTKSSTKTKAKPLANTSKKAKKPAEPTKKAPAKKSVAKAVASKTASKKAAVKKTPTSKTAPKKPAAPKAPVKKIAAPKATGAKSIPLVKKTEAAKKKPEPKKTESLKPIEPSPPPTKTPIRIQPDDIIIPKKIPLPIPPKTNTDPKIVEKIRSAHAEKELRKDLAQDAPKRKLTPHTPIPPAIKGQDRIILMVRDPYWLHAHWDISRATVDRAKAALVDQWHSVKPVLRLLKFDEVGTTDSAETVYRQIEIHGGVRNWYIDVDNPPSRFQLIMGYLTSNGRFYELVRSNTVTTPVPGSNDSFDDHWADIAKDAEKIFAQSGGYGDETNKGALAEVFEDRLKRTMELDVLSQFGSGAEGGLRKPRQFHFDVEAELLVFGTTHPDAHVSIGTEPVKIQADGTFAARLPFPDRRQVLPATARSRDGVDERTVVIAVERNTKIMEPLSIDVEDL
jgi:hypothetical protein